MQRPYRGFIEQLTTDTPSGEIHWVVDSCDMWAENIYIYIYIFRKTILRPVGQTPERMESAHMCLYTCER
jgi:hypothetical protein